MYISLPQVEQKSSIMELRNVALGTVDLAN